LAVDAVVMVPGKSVTNYDEADGVTDGLWFGWKIKAYYYEVTFDSNDGTAVNNETVNDGSFVTEPTPPTKKGYTFAGWYSNETLTSEWNFDTDKVSGYLTLYAKWIAVIEPSTEDDTEAIQKGNITLTLVDSDGNPLSYYPVELHSVVIKGTTDVNGKVTFKNVSLENHELVVFDKNGNELGTIQLIMSKSDTNSTSVNGSNINVNFNKSAISLDLKIQLDDNNNLLVKEVSIGSAETSPKTGDRNLIYYIILLIVLLAGESFVTIKKYQMKRKSQ